MSNKNFCVYAIFSAKLDRYYIGSTDEFDLRLSEHNSGQYEKAFTVKGIPWVEKLIISVLTSEQAYAMENHFKKMKSRKYLENLFKYPELIDRLKKRFE